MSPQDMTLPVIRVADPTLGIELYRNLDKLATAMDASPPSHRFVDSEGRVAHGRAADENGDAAPPPSGNGHMLAQIRTTLKTTSDRLDADDPATIAAMIPAKVIADTFRPVLKQHLDELQGLESAGDVARGMSAARFERAAEDAIPWCKIFHTCKD
jgi:hypothetical protein